MKNRWISVVLTMLLFLSACGEKQPQLVPTVEATTDFEDIEIRILHTERKEEETVLEVQWHNGTEYPVMYGEAFALQSWQDGQWVDCVMNEDTGFISIGYILQPGQTVTKFYQLRWLYGDLEDGQYRFLTSCTVTVGEYAETCKLTADFTLKSDITNTLEDITEPPELWIEHFRKELAVKGTYSWNYQTEDGNWACVNADASHPLQMKEHLDFFTVTAYDSPVILAFEEKPDDFTVRCWLDTDEYPTASHSVRIFNNCLELNMGAYIYEVTATWDDDGSGYYGTVTYIFYAAPAAFYDAMPIRTY